MNIDITEDDAREILNCIGIAENEGMGSDDTSLVDKLYQAFPHLAPMPITFERFSSKPPKQRREEIFAKFGIGRRA